MVTKVLLRFPKLHLSICHGKMKSANKDFEMRRFIKGETSIMIATTVIEVGVNVPNASIMVLKVPKDSVFTITSTQRTSRTRHEQSYCFLVTGM